MTLDERFQLLGTTEYTHEKEAIDFLRHGFPIAHPFHARALADLLDPSTGRLYEIDALVIGYAAVFVVEIKSHPGRIEGDRNGWIWTPPDTERRVNIANPYSLTNHKAKIVGSMLRKHMGNLYGVPWVQPLIFLSAENLENRLSHDGKIAVTTRETFFEAIQKGRFPGAEDRRFARRIDRPAAKAIKQAFDKMGLRARETLLQVGDYVLENVFEDGDDYQDRAAHHAQFEHMKYRARVYLVPEQTSVENKQRLRRAAEREVQLLWTVRDNPNILSSHYYAPDGELGPTLVLEDFEGSMRLDRFLARHKDLPFEDRVDLIRQIGHALHFCHRRNVAHGGLSPEAVLVRRNPAEGEDGALEIRLFNFQLGGSEDASATVHRTALGSNTAGAYQAPELANDPGATSPLTDAFSLGALAYYVFTGQAPASSQVELVQKLYRDGALDPAAVADDLPEKLVEFVQTATSLDASNRLDDTALHVELLVEDLRPKDELAEPESTANVLEAEKGDILAERFEVKRVLGHGASARVLDVVGPDKEGQVRHFALKVSRGPDHDDRIRKEGEQLQRIRHARIVECHEILKLDGRTCLLLSLAGATLQQVLADEGSLDLDLASRYGEDLLDALKTLEDEGVAHRDIKPANLGVGSRKKKAKHLTLFDFSLLDTSMSELEVGTAPYRDPFLPLRGAWDAQADRWSAAVTLHEMLTGLRPRYGRPGQAAVDPKATLHLESERFDAGLRDRLITFFEQALARELERRFESATDMARAWSSCFDARPQASSAPTRETPMVTGRGGPIQLGAVTDAQLAKITPATPIRALPLSVRAQNALDRAGLTQADELRSLPRNRLSAIRGIGNKVAREILELRDAWAAKLADDAQPQAQPFLEGYRGEDVAVESLKVPVAVAQGLEDAGLRTSAAVARAPRAQVSAVLKRCGSSPKVLEAALQGAAEAEAEDREPQTLGGWLDALFPAMEGGKKAPKHQEQVQMLLGLRPPLLGVCGATLQEGADAASVTRQRMQQVLATSVSRWREMPWRDGLRERCLKAIREENERSGALPLELAAQRLGQTIPDDVHADPEVRVAQYAALIRAASELGPDASGDRVTLRRRTQLRGEERRHVVWALAGEDEELWHTIKRLGETADDLAQRVPLASSGETYRALAAVVDETPLAKDEDEAADLLTLAASASRTAARSSRLELYPVGMPASRALELSAQALSAAELSPEEIVTRVRARYPEAEPLPTRPQLDRLVASLSLKWSDGRYRRPQASGSSSLLSSSGLDRRKTVVPSQRSMSESSMTAKDFEDSVVGVLQDRKLRVLAVNTAYMPDAVSALERVLKTRAVAVDRLLVEAMEAVLSEKGGKPEVLWSTDAEGPEGKAWSRLLSVAKTASDRVIESLVPSRDPLLLVQLGLLARYELRDFVDRLVEANQSDETGAVVVLNPAHEGDRQDVLNASLHISGLLAGQSGWIPREWIENKHRAATAH
ncbi:MAG: BREX system serine/threonine kinase PglW [Nannocystaceae bacterium]|nr:BREX system serine/threonine kinase PglW [bacterium]